MTSALRWGWVVSTTPRPLYPRERPGTHCKEEANIKTNFLEATCKNLLNSMELTPLKVRLRTLFNVVSNLTLVGPCIIFAIYIHSNEIHNVVALIKFLLVLRCQLYMFRTITVHPQELLCRYCMCRLWYVLRNALPDTSSWYNVLGRTGQCNYIVYLVGLYI